MPPARSKRPRRKAKQTRAHETVSVILEAAAQVLVSRGYASATTNHIAATAGVSVGTVYEYFADKEEVFEALIDRELGRIVEAVRTQPIDPEAPVGEQVARVLAAAMGALHLGPELFRVLEQVPDAALRTRLSEARTAVVAFIRRLLEVHRSELRVDDLDLAAFMVVSAAEGIGANATREIFDARLGSELTAMLTAYLTGPRT